MTPAWSTDISAAPRGKRVTVRKIGKDGKINASTRMDREQVWLASKCGKVILSEWLWPKQDGQTMTKARWLMFCAGSVPLAWRPFIEGEFPSHIDPDTKTRAYPKGKGPEFPAMILGVVA
jgi:hypothetical protein